MATWLITRFQTLWPRRASMLWHLCQSTLSKPHQIQWVWIHSAVPETHYCWAQECLMMSYVFILQHYLRVLVPCCNPTNHPKQMPYRDEYNLQVLKALRISVTSMMEVLRSTKFHGKLGRLMSHCVESILSMTKKKYDQPKFGLMATQAVFYRRQSPSEMEEIIFLLERGNLGTLLKRVFLSVKGNQWKYIFVGWWNGDTNWDWLEACWRVFVGGIPLQL